MASENKNLARETGSWQSRVKRTMTVVALVLASVLLLGLGYLFAISPGRPTALRTADGTSFRAACPSG
jgi:Tfp pilus assembly protein PilO